MNQQNIPKQKIEKEYPNKFENKKIEKDGNLKKEMAYFCRLCQCKHYTGSEAHKRHKRYAVVIPLRRRAIRRSSLKKFFEN